jgi:hypothetical protein
VGQGLLILKSLLLLFISYSFVESVASTVDCSLKEIPCERFNYSDVSSFESSFRVYGLHWKWPTKLVEFEFSSIGPSCASINVWNANSIVEKSPAALWLVGHCLLSKGVERGLIFELEQSVISQFINFNRK